MSVVVPAITEQTKEAVATEWLKMQPFASRIHVDMMDGEFAPGAIVAPSDLSWSQGWEVDIHLMYQQPMTQLAAISAMVPKPSLVIFHGEAEGDLMEFTKGLRAAGIKAGIALVRPTVPSDKIELIEAVDHVLIFSGDLGKHGGKANMLQLEKVQLIRKINPEAEIGWDGGATIDNAYTLALGGVDVINVGNTLASADDPAEVFRKLDFEVHRKDVLKKKEVE